METVNEDKDLLANGEEVIVGHHKVIIERYLSKGGFAKIYVVNESSKGNVKGEELCLKRVIVKNKEGLNQLRAEVEVMQRLSLRGSRNIVKYIDSNARKLEAGEYEVLVLMELCSNKSLLDFMNTRLTTKLSEVEIIKIMKDICFAVYEMHLLKLIHRDIKIENVLIDKDFNFKLCDFGSTCPVLRIPQTPQEFQILHNDLMHQTTPQYRSPEMIDLYRGIPIDEKSDVWALGIFLYKLCYYITPFEGVGELGILHSAYSFPSLPNFSVGLKKLINLMLQENPMYRPNIYQIIVELGKIEGVSKSMIKIEDFYGLGEYSYPSVEQRFQKMEPFTASVVPMYSPFRDLGMMKNILSASSSNINGTIGNSKIAHSNVTTGTIVPVDNTTGNIGGIKKSPPIEIPPSNNVAIPVPVPISMNQTLTNSSIASKHLNVIPVSSSSTSINKMPHSVPVSISSSTSQTKMQQSNPLSNSSTIPITPTITSQRSSSPSTHKVNELDGEANSNVVDTDSIINIEEKHKNDEFKGKEEVEEVMLDVQSVDKELEEAKSGAGNLLPKIRIETSNSSTSLGQDIQKEYESAKQRFPSLNIDHSAASLVEKITGGSLDIIDL